jgi:hypothetical protein
VNPELGWRQRLSNFSSGIGYAEFYTARPLARLPYGRLRRALSSCASSHSPLVSLTSQLATSLMREQSQQRAVSFPAVLCRDRDGGPSGLAVTLVTAIAKR